MPWLLPLLRELPGIDVNFESGKQGTALRAAAGRTYPATVQALLQTPGIKVNLQNWQPHKPKRREGGPNKTALMVSAQHGKVDIVRELLRSPRIDTSIRDIDRQNAEQLATDAGHHRIARLLRQHSGMR